uniref:Uncharacterized protein n=1 Tax=Podoviridae sp. ctlpi2 TaxID=2826574 RepID=A0A8S5MLF7_9CAUD|nr:MAG TPA: hypothetical protein [Podoviridae sp. ctlpi2]
MFWKSILNAALNTCSTLHQSKWSSAKSRC